MQEVTYQIGDGWGESADNPSVEDMQKFLDKLDIDDEEHCEVWLTNDLTDWTLSCFPNNTIVFYESSENSGYKPRHLTSVSRNKMLELWEKLAKGQIDELEKEPWKAGHTSEPPPPSIDPKDLHRDFWNQLINAKRRPNFECRADGCRENAIELSVLCPKHHFESTVKITCPFV
jgi:hypothetical protein